MKVKTISIILTVLALLLAEIPSSALDNSAEPEDLKSESTQGNGPADPMEMENFIDDIMSAHMKAYHIPGAAISIVKDGELVFAKGYGYSDIEHKKTVNPNATIFRIGSISKLFIFTAIMQLAGEKKIDLNADVNIYLNDFKIPYTYPEPITISHLMTHTTGFEGRGGGLVSSPEKIEPAGKSLANFMPARVRPPGELAGYSNYGTALAGYIVETVSGMPFEEYIEKNIYFPLEMKNSTFSQPLPSELVPDMATGYSYKNGKFVPHGFEYFSGIVIPSGAMSTTAADMAKFMIMHLQDGSYKNNSVLERSASIMMHTQQFTHDLRINGMCYGFFEDRINNRRIIKHGGVTGYFRSILVLLPEENLGLFVSFNIENDGGAQVQFIKSFFDRYYPSDPLIIEPEKDVQHNTERFTGSYASTRSAMTTIEKIGQIISNMIFDVSKTSNGIMFDTKRFVEVEFLVFREENGGQILIFQEDNSGRITHMFSSAAPHGAFIKMEWYETPVFHYILLGITIFIFLVTLIVRPLMIVTKRKEEMNSIKQSSAYRVIWYLSLLNIFFITGLVIGIINLNENILNFPNEIPAFFLFLLVLPLLAFILTIAASGFTILAWKKSCWNLTWRLYYTIVTLASAAFIWFLDYWNLLGFNF